ncbi:MAG: DUF4783 domain-containing protein [Bacteroidia bacterium]
MMKSIKRFSTLFLLGIQLFAFGQDAVVKQIEAALLSGDVSKISTYFDSSIEVVTPDTDGVYSQNQASQVLKSFFNQYPCSSYTVGHTGNSAGGSKFIIGSYTSKGQTFRVSIFLKKVGENYLIQGLSFED